MQDLKNTFNWLSKQSYQNIQGTTLLDTCIDGPTLGITVMTHGNEPGGLAAVQMARNLFSQKQITKGRIFLVINNLKAAQKYIQATTEEEKKASRYIDVNMNRLPEELLDNDARYEVRRAKELLPVWQQFDAGFDIHTTSQDCPPMIIEGGDHTHDVTKYFPIFTVIQNIDVIQTGLPAFDYYGNGDIPTFEIEAGCHELPTTFRCVEDCTSILLSELGMLKEPVAFQQQKQHIYKVVDSLFAPSTAYRMAQIFENFAPIQKGTVIASTENDDVITSPISGVTLFAFNSLEIDSVDEEILFLAEEITA